MAIRVGRDSTTAADIPLAGLQVVMGYGNGRFAWTPADWARFPATVARVRIDVNGTDPQACGVLDVESGDATPAQAPAWVKTRKALGAGPHGRTIYTSRSLLAAVDETMKAAGLERVTDYTLWVATLDGTRTLPSMTGVVAVQYAGEAQTGGHYDQSAVYDDAWHPAPVVVPPKPPSWQARALAQARAVVATLEAHQ